MNKNLGNYALNTFKLNEIFVLNKFWFEMAKIAVIGAGASGMTATKACLEEGLQVVVYEKTRFTGGLWRYHEDDVSEIASVAKSTIINSSKEMSAFSDFPPPKEYPNYMHNTMMVNYIDLYGKSFDFEKFVKFNHQITSCEPAKDFEETGRWKLKIKNLTDGNQFEELFDGVMVCTGHHTTPSVPQFEGEEKFKGKVMHTHSYKKPDGFQDKNVVVIGIGNSGGDAAVELSTVAKNVYLSTRRGTWVVNRVGPSGLPADFMFLRRSKWILFELLPYDFVCSMEEKNLNKRFDHSRYQLKPEHHIFSQHVFVNDALPNRILSGTIKVKGNIKRFTENGVIFDGDQQETQCDIVLLATGYKVEFPFISKSLIPTDRNQVELFKYMFSPRLTHPKTLAFIGLIQPIGAIFPISEIQSRWFALLMNNKLSLPSKDEMMKDIRKKRLAMEKRFYSCERHTVQVDWIPFMDEIAQMINAKPNLLKYFFTDPKLWHALWFGPCLPYQYRLNGPHPWPKAKETILTVFDRIEAPFKTKTNITSNQSKNNSIYENGKVIFSILILCFFVFAFFKCLV